MSQTRPTTRRALLLSATFGLVLTACGRRGPLEAPPKATNATDLPDRDIGGEEEEAPSVAGASPLGKPARSRRAITIPEKPFVLDPLL